MWMLVKMIILWTKALLSRLNLKSNKNFVFNFTKESNCLFNNIRTGSSRANCDAPYSDELHHIQIKQYLLGLQGMPRKETNDPNKE